MKYLLRTYPVLKAPDFNQLLVIAVDASNGGIGVVLLKVDDQNKMLPNVTIKENLVNITKDILR